MLFLAHPGAGSGHNLRKLQLVRDGSPELRRRSEVLLVKNGADAASRIAMHGESALVVAVGGDGVANLVAHALLEAAVPGSVLGVLPLGTGNAFAHSLGIPTVAKALMTMSSGSVRHIDVLRTTHPGAPLALVSLSFGFEGEWIRRYSRGRHGGRWRSAASATILATLRAAHGIGMALDGMPFVEPDRAVHNAGLYNLSCYGSGRVLWPEADSSDGWAEAAAFRTRRSYWKALRKGLTTSRARDEAGFVVRRWRRAEVTTSAPVQFDGESAECGDFSVRVDPRALPVLVPSVEVPR